MRQWTWKVWTWKRWPKQTFALKYEVMRLCWSECDVFRSLAPCDRVYRWSAGQTLEAWPSFFCSWGGNGLPQREAFYGLRCPAEDTLTAALSLACPAATHCIHTRMRGLTYAHVNAHRDIHALTRTHIHALTWTRINTCTHTRAHAWIHIRTRERTQRYTRTHTDTHTRTHMDTHKHMHTHTRTCMDSHTHT